MIHVTLNIPLACDFLRILASNYNVPVKLLLGVPAIFFSVIIANAVLKYASVFSLSFQ